MKPPKVQPTNYRGVRKYRVTLHRDELNGVYSREEIEALAAEIDRILAAERATTNDNSRY